MLPSDDETRVTKQIVQAYRASGLNAKTYQGQPFVEREDGWEGPLDVRELQKTYLAEINRLEQLVRGIVREWYDSLEGSLSFSYRDACVQLRLIPEVLVRLGFDERRARIYVSIARSLRYRGDLWR